MIAMWRALTGVAVLGAFGLGNRAEAQLPFRLPVSVEVHVGAGVPVGDFTDRDPGVGAEAGAAFGAGAALHLSRVLAVFGGYSQTTFGCSECANRGIDDEIVDRGGDFGLQAEVPTALIGLQPWLRVGGVYHELEFSGLGGSEAAEPALGFLVAGGVTYPILHSLMVIPQVGYRSYSAEFELGGLENQTVEVSQLLVGVRLSYRF